MTTIPARILAALGSSPRPLTARELVAAVLPGRPRAVAANQLGVYLRRLKLAGKVRSKPAARRPRVARGKPPLAWELAGQAGSRDGAGCDPPARRGRPPKAAPALAPRRACGRVAVPARAGLLPDRVWLDFHAALHPSTSPAAIASAQRRDVAAHLGRHPGATAAEVAEAVCLPRCSVERIVAALGGGARKAKGRAAA